MSLPVWGEWIEIMNNGGTNNFRNVSPRVGRVD